MALFIFHVYRPPVLSRRFEIQDIVAQDSFGVTYLALDAETGSPLAVQRFFPFGADGGGLLGEERNDYAAVVAQLVGFQHPGLRSVFSGGCDPVDGMPFVASEWIEGESLAELLQRKSFTFAGTLGVLERVLEISEIVSEVLGAEAVWVETATELIIDDAGESRRGLTFELAPMKWLGSEGVRHSMLPLAELTEDLLGWRRKRMPTQAGQGLGAWVKWLRANADTITLRQAWESLSSLAGEIATRDAAPEAGYSGTPPAGTPLELRDDEQPRPGELPIPSVSGKKPFFKNHWLLLGVLIGLLGVGTAVGLWRHRPSVAHGASGSMLANRGINSGETERIKQAVGHEVTVEGPLAKIGPGPDGIWYLDFQGSSLLGKEVRGYFKTGNQPDAMAVQELSAFIGKRIRITGVVEIKTAPNENWPQVLLKNRQAIQPVK